MRTKSIKASKPKTEWTPLPLYAELEPPPRKTKPEIKEEESRVVIIDLFGDD